MNRIKKTMAGKTVAACLLTLSSSIAFSGTMGPVAVEPTSKVYAGIFGGGGSVSRTDMSLFGTAFFTEAEGGSLAINAFGRSDSDSTGMIGGHIGFAWLNNAGKYLPVTVAAELEGYYMGGIHFEGHEINNETVRLPEHDFLINYPLKTGVFLANAVLNSNASLFDRFQPYVGIGIGTALISISNASALQTSPAELGVNHFNADLNDKALAFAAQPKAGVRYNFSSGISVYAEYRFLYLSETKYTFGSTVYPAHATTAPWQAKIKSQNYNMGSVGIDFDL